MTDRMERLSIRDMTLGLVLVISLFLSVVSSVEEELAPAMFIFGDSLIDDGNNNYLPAIARANYFPYGIDFGYPSGRFCNGRTVVDFGAEALGLPLVPPYLSPTSKGNNILKGLNFASAAAGILEETGLNYAARVSFNQQLTLFEKAINIDYKLLFHGDTQALSQYLAASVYVVNFGSNDYINNYLMPDLYSSAKLYTPETYADLLIRTYAMQIKRLYNLGARKIILVTAGPIGCAPSQLAKADTSGACVEHVNQMVAEFNNRLLNLATTINSTLQGSIVIYQDAYNSFLDIVNNPSKYGFTVTNRACCGVGRYGGLLTCLPLEKPCENRNQYVFWDAFHPTEAVHKLIAQSCYGDAPSHCHPMSLQQLAQSR